MKGKYQVITGTYYNNIGDVLVANSEFTVAKRTTCMYHMTNRRRRNIDGFWQIRLDAVTLGCVGRLLLLS